ncbi:ATP-utilizing chromatin assembly and remodelling N-terminal-domain-containing protein [Geopyxis carbonaria]|nr:ATP-utilizing chromatin assembly and remodelling N-terminal-domain-containing protein [Geopyxis carbonaria]
MVLYKRKPVQTLTNPVIEDTSQEIWQISQTGEIFTSAQSYMERLEFYKSKQFSCEITGHMNLNYFEALNSETTHAQDVEQAFPEPLKEPVLRKVQFSQVSRIDALVDQLHDSFKSDFYPGEHATAILQGGDRVEAVIREKTMFPELRYANGDIQRKGFSRYTVKMVNRNEEEAQIDNEHLIRDKKTFTKAMLRSFIKNTVSREPWNGAPWLVKEEYATRYKIPQNIPPHLQKASTSAERKAQQARRKQESLGLSVGALTNNTGSTSPSAPVEIRPAPKSHKSKTQQAMKMSKLLQGTQDPGNEGTSVSATPWNSSPGGTPERPVNNRPSKGLVKQELSPAPPPPPKPIKYPIEDLDLPPKEDDKRPKLHYLSSLTTTTITDQESSTSSPDLEESVIDETKASFYLSTWVYLNIYCEPLVLDSFTFDDYFQALQINTEDVHCELLVEIHCALLKAIVDTQGALQAQLPEAQEEEESEEEEEEEDDEQDDEAEPGSIIVRPEGSDSGSRKSPGTEKKHRADELFSDGDSWIQRLKLRDFKNGGWEAIVVGILYQLSSDRRYSRDTDPILAGLAPPDSKPTFESVKSSYAVLDCNLRVMIIHLLSRLTHETRSVRDYMEECAEEMTKHRKEKIEHQRTRKVYLEELKSLEDDRKILLPENTPKSPSPEPQPSTDDDGDLKMNGMGGEDEEMEDADPVRGLRRGGDRASERKRKRVEEKAKSDAAAKIPKTSKQFQKVLKSIEATHNKILKEEEKISNIDEDLRQADCARFRMMGKDRFWNTYWWFERNGMPFGGLPTSSTASSGYANAMIWIQGPHESERQGFLVDARPNFRTDADGDVTMNGNGCVKPTILERQEREENGSTLKSPTEYAYIDTPEEFEQLLSWLDVRGIREKKLKASLEAYKPHIVKGMENRAQYLAESVAAASDKETSSGRSTRGKTYYDPTVWRCLNWNNLSMVEEDGHTHYDHPQPRKNSKKSKEAKGVPLNRQGKPVSRQGERYAF